MIRPLLRLLFATSFSLFFVASASAAVVTWDGGGGADTNWGTCANWSGNTCPTSSDIATFDATSTNNVTIAATLTGSTAPAGIDINTGYTGTITQNAGVSITVGASNYDQAAGTFTGGDSAITINGAFIVSAGTFTSTTGTLQVSGAWTHTAGTFTHNNGTVTFTGSSVTFDFATSETFYAVNLNATNVVVKTISASDTMIVVGTYTATDGGFGGASGTLELRGDATFASTADAHAAPITFTGTGDQTLTLTPASNILSGGVTVNKASGNLYLGANFTNNTSTFTVTLGSFYTRDSAALNNYSFSVLNYSQGGGTFNGAGSTVSYTGTFTLSGGTYNQSTGTTTYANSFTHTAGGTFNHNNGTSTFTGSSVTFNFATSETFYAVNLNATNVAVKTISASDTMIVVGTYTATDGGFGGASGTLELRGDATFATGADAHAAPITFTGTGDQTLTLTPASNILSGGVTVNKASGNLYLGANFTNNTVTFTMTLGSFYTRDSAALNNYSFSVLNYSQGGGTFNGAGSTVSYTGTFTLSGGTYNQSTGTTTYANSFTHTAGGTFNHNNGTSTFTGGSVTLDFATSETFYVVNLNPSNVAVKTISASDTMIVVATYSVTEGGFGGASGTLELRGDATFATGADAHAAAITFTGTGDQTLTLTPASNILSGGMTVNKASGNLYLGANFTNNTSTFTVTLGSFYTRDSAALNNYSFSVLNYSQGGGTFNGAGSTVSHTGTFTLSGGTYSASTATTSFTSTYTHTGGGTFTHNSGTASFIGGNATLDVAVTETFGGITINKNNLAVLTVATGDTIVATGTTTFTEGTWGTGTFEAQGDVTVAATFDVTSTANFKFTGGGTQAFTMTTVTKLSAGDMYVNKSGGQVNLGSTLTMNTASNDFIIQEGTFDLNGNNISVTAGATETFIVETGGNLQLQGGETITGDSASYPQLDSGSTVTYDGTVGPYTLKNYTYHHLVINGSGATFSPAANEVLGGNLTVTAGTLDVNDLTLAINGNTVINGGTMKSGTNTVTFGDAGADSVTISSGTLEIESDSPGADIVKNATTWTNSGGTITYNAATGITGVVLSGLAPYFNLAINSSGSTYSLQANTDVDSSVTLTAGTLDVSGSNYNMTVGGGWTDAGAGTFTEGTGTVTFDGTGTINSNEAFENVTIAGTVTLGAALDADATLIISSGSLDVSGSNFGITVGGGWTDTGAGTFTEGTGTVTFDGTGTLNSNEAFENVTINSAGTVTLGSALDADANLTITAGTLDVSGSNFGITVGGNWAKSGTFTQRSGTVTFDTAGTTSTISGSTTFNNFSCTTANKPLTFTAGTTQTISGLLTLTGSASNLIVLRSTVTDSAWNLTVNGTSSVDYVNVRDSNAGGGNAITHAVSPSRSVNVANNTNWGFNAAPTVASVTGVQASTGTANVTITFIMDDPDDDNTLQAKVEYSLDGGGSWNDPTLSTTNADTSATQGDPSVNNTVTYQVGQSGAYILSSGGANTVTTVWVGATDLLTTVNIANARIRITPYDGTLEGTAASSSNFILDRVAPSGLANFGHTDFSSSQAVLSWTAATDTNFNHYEIWHGETESQVIARSGSAVEWDNDNDSALTTASTVRTTINNTDPRNKFFKIFAVDNYGNELTVGTYYIGGGSSSSSSSGSSSGGSSSGSSSSSTTDTSTDTTDSGSSSGGSSGESTEEAEEEVTEEVVEEEVVEEEPEEEEETSGTTWEDFDVQPEEGHWSEGYVKYLEEQTNIVEVAVSQPTFLEILLSILETPNESMPRGNALEFLLVLAGHSLDTMTINVRAIAFEDVSLDDDQAGFIQYAYEQRLVQGYPDGTFQPDRIVNRAEALKLCSYFFEGDWTHPVYGDELLDLYELTENPFSDVDLNAWYAPYLINAYAKGVVDGYGDGTFGPGNSVTYAEFLKIATLMQNIEEAVELAEELE